jgi:hypothetical protein
MPMIVGKHERTLAIDGPYIHVRIPFTILNSVVVIDVVVYRSCRRRTRAPKWYLTVARRRRTTSIASFRASPASRPLPRSASSYIASRETVGISGTNSRRRVQSSRVRPVHVHSLQCLKNVQCLYLCTHEQTKSCRLSRASSLHWSDQTVSLAKHGDTSTHCDDSLSSVAPLASSEIPPPLNSHLD